MSGCRPSARQMRSSLRRCSWNASSSSSRLQRLSLSQGSSCSSCNSRWATGNPCPTLPVG